jgi:hypothetical protein
MICYLFFVVLEEDGENPSRTRHRVFIEHPPWIFDRTSRVVKHDIPSGPRDTGDRSSLV